MKFSKGHIIYTLVFIFTFSMVYTASCKTVQPDPVVIMNLHIKNGKITINSLYMAKVRLHKQAKRTRDNFMVFYNKSGKKFTHFDYIDEKTGKLQGGGIERDEVDFVLKVPYSQGMKKIDFFESGSSKKASSSEDKLIGTVEFGEYVF